MELKACPFCGGEAKLRRDYQNCIEHAQIVCAECGATGQRIAASVEYCAIDVAKEVWNKRADNDETH
jgi:transcription initiation factor TFIIIB Brf1 subunit/transcription initiation factor TFIIB